MAETGQFRTRTGQGCSTRTNQDIIANGQGRAKEQCQVGTVLTARVREEQGKDRVMHCRPGQW